MSELKPCPFGCTQPKITADNPLSPQPSIKYGVIYEDDNRERKVTVRITASDSGCLKHFWNTRPIEDALRADNEALKARVAELEAELSEVIKTAKIMHEKLAIEAVATKHAYELLELKKDSSTDNAFEAIKKLKADNARMREALRWLADPYHGVSKPESSDISATEQSDTLALGGE